MGDQQTRGDAKPGDAEVSRQQEAGRARRSRTSGEEQSDQAHRPKDRPTDDPSEAPESGDRKATGNA